jgi:hypothetical protein
VQDQASSSVLDLSGARLSTGKKPSGDGVVTRTAIFGLSGMAALGGIGLGLAAGGIVTNPVALAGGLFAALAVGGGALAWRLV